MYQTGTMPVRWTFYVGPFSRPYRPNGGVAGDAQKQSPTVFTTSGVPASRLQGGCSGALAGKMCVGVFLDHTSHLL